MATAPATNQPPTKNGVPNPETTANNTGASNVPPVAPTTEPGELKNGPASLDDYQRALVTNDPENVNLKEGKKKPADGETVHLRAVFGPMVDPTTAAVFDTNRAGKVKFGAWHGLQWDAGKLTTDD